jgi:hypothetical protein
VDATCGYFDLMPFFHEVTCILYFSFVIKLQGFEGMLSYSRIRLI